MTFLFSSKPKDGVFGSLKLKNQSIPKFDDSRWKLAGKVEKIYIYPVKSFGAILVRKLFF
jgi:hypothetical protein